MQADLTRIKICQYLQVTLDEFVLWVLQLTHLPANYDFDIVFNTHKQTNLNDDNVV